MPKKYTFLLLLLVLLDTAYSFCQHFHTPLDGDMAAIILPSDWYAQVLQDPFGISVFTENKIYAGTNRFFAHWAFSEYYKTVPLWLQHFVSPVTSVYLAGALVKIIIQLSLIGLFVAYITASETRLKNAWLPAAALVIPLLQTMGYNAHMGIIAKSVTYTFFYALPLTVLLLFFLPFYKALMANKKLRLNILQYLLLLFLAVILPFQGPLIPAVVLIVCPAALLYYWSRGFKKAEEGGMLRKAIHAFQFIPKPLLFYFILISLLSLYSLYLGTFNAENTTNTLSLGNRYARLLPGLFNQVSRKLGYPLLILLLVLNVLILKKGGEEARKLLRIFNWILVLAAIYICLLPLGGYRNYRPDIVRGDTFMPVALGLYFFFGLSTLYILKAAQFRYKKVYTAAIIAFLLILTNADRPEFEPYHCERKALEEISRATQNPVKLDTDCSVMAWEPIHDPAASEYNARLLERWNITNKQKRYYTDK